MLCFNLKKFISSVLAFCFQIHGIYLFPLGNSDAELSYTKNSQFELVLTILGFVLLILGAFTFTILSSLICNMFKNYSLCENDSLCKLFNRDFEIEEKKTEFFQVSGISGFESSEQKKTEDSIRTPLFESIKVIDFYGTKSEDSNETINLSNKMNDNFHDRHDPTLGSFRKYVQKEIQELENMNQYTKCLAIDLLPDTKNDLLERHLNDLEYIEEHLSKSLSELNELQKKLCSENKDSFEIDRNCSSESK